MGKNLDFYDLLDQVFFEGVDHVHDFEDRKLNTLLLVALHCIETYLSYVKPS